MNLVALPVLIPLFAGTVLLLLTGLRVRALTAAVASSLTLLVSLLIMLRTAAGEVIAVQMGNWPAPYGITVVADGLSSLMVVLASILALLTTLYAASSLRHPPKRGQTAELNQARERFHALALFQFLFMGVNMSFLTGDLFNLFVAFEVMLIASYGLLLLGGELAQLREGFKYVVMNLVASAIFVLSAGLAYGLFGSLNMADIAVRVAEHGPDMRITLVVAMLALVFTAKAALFPFGFWLPNAYPAPPAATSAFFSALLTKVGVYSLIRLFTLMFPEELGLQTILLLIAGLTIVFGALGAIARRRWRHVLAFANVASVGYILMGVFSQHGDHLAAALYYLTHSVLVIFALFLIAGLAEFIGGRDYHRQGHLAYYPYFGLVFFICALALAGIPPSSGFIGKYALIRPLLARGDGLALGVAGIALISGFLLLYAMMMIWRHFFWGESDAVARITMPITMRLSMLSAVVLVVAMAVFANPVYQLTSTIARQLDSNVVYVQAVLLHDEAAGAQQGQSQPQMLTHLCWSQGERVLSHKAACQLKGGNL